MLTGILVMKCLPLTVRPSSALLRYEQPICFLMNSAVLSPIITSRSRRICRIIASSKALPATLTESDTEIQPMVMTATSVVPPPISTTIAPFGRSLFNPAPRAAASGSSIRQALAAPAAVMRSRIVRFSRFVTIDGTQTTTFGLNIMFLHIFERKNLRICFVAVKSETTPWRMGLTMRILSGVRPIIS